MSNSRKTIEVVAGAGGAKGPGLIGAFKALEEKNVAVGKITGVSVGSLMAAFYANGYTADELANIFISEPLRQRVAERINSPLAWLNPAHFVTGVVDLLPHFEMLVEKYGLKPRRNLRIIAWNLLSREPVVFEGTRYNLAKALAASCAIPGVMRPVIYHPDVTGDQKFVSKIAAITMASPGVLFDGGMHHLHPTEFSKGPAIVFKLGAATRLPIERPKPIEAVFHVAEMFAGRFMGKMSPESAEDIVIPVGPSDLGGVTFSVSDQKCRSMIEEGYRAACSMLDEAINLGRVPLLSSV